MTAFDSEKDWKVADVQEQIFALRVDLGVQIWVLSSLCHHDIANGNVLIVTVVIMQRLVLYQLTNKSEKLKPPPILQAAPGTPVHRPMAAAGGFCPKNA